MYTVRRKPPFGDLPLGRFRAVLQAALLLAFSPSWPAAPASFDDSEIASAKDSTWFKQSFLNLRDDLAEARKAGKQGFDDLVQHAGCAYCKAFIERSLGDPDIAARVRLHFDTLHLEMYDDAELKDANGKTMAVKDYAKREGAMFSPLEPLTLAGRPAKLSDPAR